MAGTLPLLADVGVTPLQRIQFSLGDVVETRGGGRGDGDHRSAGPAEEIGYDREGPRRSAQPNCQVFIAVS
jgi:hypothetical protein